MQSVTSALSTSSNNTISPRRRMPKWRPPSPNTLASKLPPLMPMPQPNQQKLEAESYVHRNPRGAAIVTKTEAALGPTVLQTTISPELLTSLAPPRNTNKRRQRKPQQHVVSSPSSPVPAAGSRIGGALTPTTPPRPSLSSSSAVAQRSLASEARLLDAGPLPTPELARRTGVQHATLIHQLAVLVDRFDERGRRDARMLEEAKHRRTAQTVLEEWSKGAAEAPIVARSRDEEEAERERKAQEREKRRFERQRDEFASRARFAQMMDVMSGRKRWRVPKGCTAEVFPEPRMMVHATCSLPEGTAVEEAENRTIQGVPWVRIDGTGWIATQFTCKEGLVRLQLVPEAIRSDITVTEFLTEAGDQIAEHIDAALEDCPLDRMMSKEDAKQAQVQAQRQRAEIRRVPPGRHQFIRQTWNDMQRSGHTGAIIAAGNLAGDDLDE